MNVSVEISLYPLRADYLEVIQRFIDGLKAYPSVEVVTNNMSTQIYGDYDTVFDLLKKEIKDVSKLVTDQVFVIKLIPKDLRGTV